MLLSASLVTIATLVPAPAQADDAVVLPASETIGYLPRGLTSFGAAVDDGFLYVMGGYFGRPHSYSIEGQSRAFLKINLLDTRDVRLLQDVEPMQSVELVPVGDGTLIRVGGMHARNTADEPALLESSAVVERFHPGTDEWMPLPDMPAPRSSHRAVVLGGVLYVAGGWDLRGTSSNAEWAETLLSLDLADPSKGWTESEMPFKARALGIAAVGDRVVVLGGLTPDRSVSTDVRVFDPSTATWSDGPAFPDSGFGITAVAASGKVLASGMSGTVHSLDLESNEWSAVGELATGRMFHELVSGEAGELYALGGITGMSTSGRIRAVERLSLDTGASAPAMERVVVPAPCAAKNRFGMAVRGRSIFLFGGNNSLGQHDFETENFESAAWRLDLGDLSWTQLDEMPAARQTLAVAEVGDVGYILGGFGHDGERARAHAESMVFDFKFGDWKTTTAMPEPRSQFGVAQRGDELLVFGGLDYDPNRAAGAAFRYPTTVLSFDTLEAAFSTSEIELPRARRAFASGQVGDRFVMTGGLGESFERVEAVDVYDFSTSTWSVGAKPSVSRVGGDMFELDGRLFLVGGSATSSNGESGACRTIEAYDPAADRWEVVMPDVGMDMTHARALAVDGKILVFTMHHDDGSRAEMTWIDPERHASSR